MVSHSDESCSALVRAGKREQNKGDTVWKRRYKRNTTHTRKRNKRLEPI